MNKLNYEDESVLIPRIQLTAQEIFSWAEQLEGSLLEPSVENQDKISESVLEKYNSLNEAARKASLEEAVKFRVHQLAIAKILTKCHGLDLGLLTLAHCKLGEVYLQDQCWAQAETHLREAMTLNSKAAKQDRFLNLFHLHIMNMLARCLAKQGEVSKASEIASRITEMQKVLRLDYSSELQSSLIYEMFEFQSELQASKENHENAINLSKKQASLPVGWKKKAVALSRIVDYQQQFQNYDEAFRSQHQLIKLYEEQGQDQLRGWGLCRLAQLHQSKKDYQLAIKYYKQAVALSQDGTDKSLRQILLAKCCAKNQLFGQAVKVLWEVTTSEEQNEEGEIKLGWLYLKSGEWLLAQGKDIEASINLKKARKFYEFFQDKKAIAHIQKLTRKPLNQ